MDEPNHVDNWSERPAQPQPLLVPAAEARRLLGDISARKLAQMVAANEIPSVRIGRRRLFTLEGLHRFVSERVEGGR